MDMSSIKVPELAGELAATVTCTIEGILDEDDLRELALTRMEQDVAAPAALPVLDDPTDLKRIKERHHHVARLIANGMTQRLVASICNYDESYLSILLNNPSMMELVELYRIQAGASVEVITERLRTMALKATEKLNDKLDADEITDVNELTSIAKLGFDRSGQGPQSKQHVVKENHIIDHAELQRHNAAIRARNREQIVPASEVRAALTYTPKEQNDEGRTAGEAVDAEKGRDGA